MRSRKKQIISLLLAMTMLAGDASLAYAAEEPRAEAVTEKETEPEQTEQEEAEESTVQQEQEKPTEGDQSGSVDQNDGLNPDGQETPENNAETETETEPAVPQVGAEDVTEGLETAESVQMADAVSGEYTYTASGVNATITGYTGSSASLVIPEELDGYTVQAIGDNAFAGNLTLTSVEIPASVETIGSLAFDNCVNLKTVTLTSGLVTMGREFLRGTGVTELTLPKTATDAYYALGGAQNLTKVILAEGSKAVPNGLLRRYGSSDPGSNVSEVVLPESVTGIGDHAFYNCDLLTGMELPDGLETIGNYAFYGCDRLEGVKVPGTVTGIGDRAFEDCVNLKSAVLNAGGAGEKLTVGSSAFAGCVNLAEMTIPGNVTELGNYVFDGAVNLKTVAIENGVEALGIEFLCGTAVTEIVLPKSVTDAYYALGGAQNLTKVTLTEGSKAVPNGLLRRYSSSEPGSNVSEVVLPESVTGIGDHAFYNCDLLTGMELPDGLETIGNYAFYGCDRLEGVKVPGTVTGIGDRAFEDCVNLKSAVLNAGEAGEKLIVGSSAFAGCVNLTEIMIPGKVTELGDYVFDGAVNLKTVAIENGVEALGIEFLRGTAVTEIVLPKSVTDAYYALGGAQNLTKVTLTEGSKAVPNGLLRRYGSSDPGSNVSEVVLPESVTAVGDYAFADCDQLLEISLPDGLETIGRYAFSDCDGLAELVIPASAVKIDERAFESCDALTKVIFEEGGAEKTIGSYAFKDCKGLTSLALPGDVVSIGNWAFAGCTGLASITLAEGAESIGNEFLSDTAVTELTLPKSVTDAYYALGGAQNLTKVTLAEGSKAVPNGLLRRYGSSDPGSNVSEVVLPESVTAVGDYAFADCDQLLEISLPDGLETIGRYAFSDCDGLAELVIPASAVKIDERAFESCDALTKVIFEEGGAEKAIGSYAFKDCKGLTSLALPGDVVSIGNWAFAGCTGLASITLAEGAESIGNEFLSDTAVTELTLPRTVTDAYYALGGTQSLKKVILAEGSKAVPDGLMRSYSSSDPGSNVSEVVLPESVTAVGDYAFSDCDQLLEIGLPDGLETMGRYAFSDCDGLEGITIPASTVKIDEYAFESCDALEDVIFSGDAALAVGTAAFADCLAIVEIALPDGTVSLGSGAFQGCAGLRDITLNDGLDSIGSNFIQGTQVASLTIPKTVTSMTYALSGAVGLQSVTFAQGMQRIPGRAVAKYHSSDPDFVIHSIYLPDTINEFGTNCFQDFTGTLYIEKEDSEAAFIAIDNEINYQAKVSGIQDREGRYLNRDKTYYRMAMSSATNSGYVNLALQYSFKEEALESLDVSDMELTIKLPSAATVSANSFKLNGAEYPTAADKNGYIVIPVTETEGTASFSLQLPDTQYMMSYAELTYRYEGTEKTEPIGIVNMGTNVLTLSVPDETESSLVTVRGFTQPENQVDLYLEGTKTATITASKTGVYSAEILLAENPADGDMFKIEAKTAYGDKETSAVAYIKYKTEAVSLTQCTMYYRNKEYDLLTIAGTRPVISWVSGTTFTFKIAFNHNDKVGEVQIVSAKNGEEKVLEAQWNEEEQAFVAAGFKGYVPGVLTVRYGNSLGEAYEGAVAVTEAVYEDGNTIGHESRVALNNISEFYYLKEQETGIPTLPDADFTRVEVDGENGYLNLETVYVERENKTYGCQEMYIPEADGTYTLIRLGIGLENTETAEAALYGIAQSWPMSDSAVDTAKEVKKLIDLLAEESEDPDDAEVYALLDQTLQKAEEAFEYGSKEYAKVQELKGRLEVAELMNNATKAYNKTRKVIENAAHYGNDPDIIPSDEITEEMKRAVDAMEKLSKNVTNKQLQKIMEEMTDSGWFDDSLLEKMLEDVFEDMNEELEFNAKYAIDPSGYVYEGFPENRLEGVKATIYYQDPETKETVLWNAAEYDQSNPLYTDEDGAYAWDVPEGLWQVKYEKEGYETAYSEWLPVPPPQLDVNIGMISLEAPQVESLTVFSDRAEVVFSKYMIPESLGEMKLLDKSGKELAFALEYDEAGESEDGTPLAKEFVLRLDGDSMLEPGSSCRLVLSGSEKSYADVAAQRGETAVEVQQNLEIIAPDEVSVKMGEALDVPVYLSGNREGLSLEAVSGYEELMTVQEVTNESVKIYGKLYGETELILRVPGTDIQETVKVTIGRATQDAEVQPSVVLSQSVYTMHTGENLEIVPEVYPKGAAEGSWNIVSGDEVVSMKANTVTAKKTGEAVLRYTLDAEVGSDGGPVYAECRILIKEAPAFVRGDANGDGETGIDDLRLVLRHVCRKITLEGTAYQAADVTDDGEVGIDDLRKILRFVCKKITEL